MALRLQKLRNGQSWLHKLQLTLIPLMTKVPVSDVLRTLFYRPKLFGKAFSGLVQSALRGPSPWTVAERELFAGYVSARNQCAF